MAYRVGKVGAMLREESQNKHLLRSRLIWVWEGNIKPMIEPLQAVIAQLPSIYKSAMLVGDVVRIYMSIYSNDCLYSYLRAYMMSLPETLYHYFSKMQCVAAACIVLGALLQERI